MKRRFDIYLHYNINNGIVMNNIFSLTKVGFSLFNIIQLAFYLVQSQAIVDNVDFLFANRQRA